MSAKKIENKWILTYNGITVEHEILEIAQAQMLEKVGAKNA